jgi:hypothetical protein
MLSVHMLPPSCGITNRRSVPEERFCRKTSPDQAIEIQVSPLVRASM